MRVFGINIQRLMYTNPGSGLFFAQVAIVVALTAAYRFRRALARLLSRRADSDSQSGS